MVIFTMTDDSPIRTFERKGNTFAINIGAVTDLKPQKNSFPTSGPGWDDKGILVELSPTEKVERDNNYVYFNVEEIKLMNKDFSRYNIKERKKAIIVKIPDENFVWIKPLTKDSNPEEVKSNLKEIINNYKSPNLQQNK